MLGAALIHGSAAVVACVVLAGCAAQAAVFRPLADLVRDAETAELNVTNPPASYIRDGDPTPVRQPILERADAALAREYADPALAQELANVHRAITTMLDQKGGGRIGGVTSVVLSNVQISAAAAHAKARVTVWFKSAQFWWQDPKAFHWAATSVIDFDLHFVHMDDVWRIDHETWQFAPGGGP